jgi:hypothetical protein
MNFMSLNSCLVLLLFELPLLLNVIDQFSLATDFLWPARLGGPLVFLLSL